MGPKCSVVLLIGWSKHTDQLLTAAVKSKRKEINIRNITSLKYGEFKHIFE